MMMMNMILMMIMRTQVHPKLCLPPVLGKVNQGFQSKKEVFSLHNDYLFIQIMIKKDEVVCFDDDDHCHHKQFEEIYL